MQKGLLLERATTPGEVTGQKRWVVLCHFTYHHKKCFPTALLTTTQLAQFDMCQSAKLEVTGSNSNWTNTQGLNLSN